MKTIVILRIHGIKEIHHINARNLSTAGAQAMLRCSPKLCRLHDIKIHSIIGLTTTQHYTLDYDGQRNTYTK